MKRVVLIDGHSLLFRAYHALPKTFTDKKGNPTNAVYGFTSMLIRVVDDLKPDFLAVVFDEKGPTFRHQELVTYKEGRPEMDEELSVQGPVVKKLLGAFGIPVFSVEGYEGEDIIATAVAQIKNLKFKIKNSEEIEFYVVSGDRDVLQLIDDQVKVYSPKKGLSEPVVYDEKNMEEVFGVKASQIPDFKGLCGDASDRIPGVFGVGEKTAAELVRRYGSIEKLYQKLAEVKKEFGEKLVEKLSVGAEQAVLSKRIAQISGDVPLSLEFNDLRFGGLRKTEAIEFLKSLGFKSLLKRLGHQEMETEKKTRKSKVGGKPNQPALDI